MKLASIASCIPNLLIVSELNKVQCREAVEACLFCGMSAGMLANWSCQQSTPQQFRP